MSRVRMALPRMTGQQRIDLLLLAARAPGRTQPEQHLLEGEAFKLLTGRHERRWVIDALEAGVCPMCCWPVEPCPECGDPYCGSCDAHVENMLDLSG